MADPADLAREACALLAGYLPVLERLVAEPSSAPGGAAGMTPRAADAPEPWDAQAGRALMDSLEGVRRLKAALLYALSGHPGVRHGMSEGNTAVVLAAIPKLAAGLDRDGEAAVVRMLERWINEARSARGIDEAEQWRPLRSRACPYCGCWFLRVLLDEAGHATSHVECHAACCCGDGNGLRPVAAMGTDDHGRPVLAWADGLVETVPDADGLRP